MVKGVNEQADKQAGPDPFPEIEIVTTSDGSHTIYVRSWNEPYHSMHGAIAESEHIFIRNGLLICSKKQIRIFEVGFGTGLNALLTLREAMTRQLDIRYDAVDIRPLERAVYEQLNYASLAGPKLQSVYTALQGAAWNEAVEIQSGFILHKIEADLVQFEPEGIYDVVYFDAFAPLVQPEMWSSAIFSRLFNHMHSGGILVTYSARGEIRRRLLDIGFEVKRVPGPKGKREILKAVKP